MSDAVLELTDVSKTYSTEAAELAVLRGADFTLNAGEVVGLVAPSGAGKSTLLHIAGLLDTADTGTVSIKGTAMTGQSDNRRTSSRRRDIGFVYQFHHLLPEFSAAENIALPQRINGVAAAAAAERSRDLLDRVGLADRADHRPAELSGGEQQRVAFCRAMANQPSLLLADEPTGNLDPATAEQVFQALLGLARETGLAALIATHNIALAEQMDRVVMLKDGQVTAA